MPNQHLGSQDLALVLSGGGARGAYQVGFLRALAKRHPDLQIPILTGVSAGAINAAYLANEPTAFRDKVEALAALWAKITTDQIFRVDLRSLANNVVAWGGRLLVGRASSHSAARSMVDASPLCAMLEHLLRPTHRYLPGIAKNLAAGALKAVAVTASSYSTGQSVTWVQGMEPDAMAGVQHKIVRCKLRLDHILASAALPLLFPAVRINRRWFGDGGIRMTAPLSPAVHLGARKILAISTRFGRGRSEMERPYIDAYPPPAQVMGALFNAIFLDVLDNDAQRLTRINELIEKIPEHDRGGLRPVKLLLLRPSRDLGRLAGDYEAALPRAFRFMTRGLGTQETRSNDILSLLMFQPDYLQHLIELGYEDAEARRDEIDALLSA
ncbi:MAG: patatin-like phospholipase family protein [Gammaproteobacteria bacterium]